MRGTSTNVARLIATLVFPAAMVLLLTGCASIIKGSDQSVSFESNPSDARLVITDVREGKDVYVGSTPFTTSLKRGAGYFKKAKYKVTMEKPGYKKEEVLLEGSPNGWYLAGNLVFGGLIGWLVVDPLTGAMWTLDPEAVNVTLKRAGASRPQDDGLTIVLRSALPAELEGKLKLVRPPSRD